MQRAAGFCKVVGDESKVTCLRHIVLQSVGIAQRNDFVRVNTGRQSLSSNICNNACACVMLAKMMSSLQRRLNETSLLWHIVYISKAGHLGTSDSAQGPILTTQSPAQASEYFQLFAAHNITFERLNEGF